jgi:pheromone a factor receptor
MAIDLIVQGHRFDIVEDEGCSFTTYWSWASIFLFYVPPIVLGLVNSVYAGSCVTCASAYLLYP